MSYKHLTIEERCCLREYYKKGYSYRKIAELMGSNVSTISRELNRNFTHMYDLPTYYPHTAQKKYLLRRSYCHRGMFQEQAKIDYIKEKLLLTWSPEQIANTPCELNMPSTRTIALINARPKKVLNYNNPLALFEDSIKKCCT